MVEQDGDPAAAASTMDDATADREYLESIVF